MQESVSGLVEDKKIIATTSLGNLTNSTNKRGNSDK